MKREAIDAAILASSQKTTMVGGAAGVAAFLANLPWLGILSFIVALSGLLISWYYNSKKNRREEKEHQLRIEEQMLRIKNLRGECNINEHK